MSSINESNQVDELFREELNNYTVPVTLATGPLLVVAAKKGLFHKVAALLKANTLVLIAGTATTLSVATLATVKIVERYQNKTAVVHKTKSVTNSNIKESSSQRVVDALKQMSAEAFVKSSVGGAKIQDKETRRAKNISTQNPKIEKQTAAKGTEAFTQSQQNQPATKTAIASPATTSQNEATTVAKDTVQKNVTPVRRVVYVKPKPVIVQDTVVKVIKKVRPVKK